MPFKRENYAEKAVPTDHFCLEHGANFLNSDIFIWLVSLLMMLRLN
jgi:hypothetical protein